MNLKSITLVVCGCLLSGNHALSNDNAPANSELVVDQTFESDALDSKWHINTGSWKVVDGVLRATEMDSEKHSAAARFPVETENAVYQLRFRMVGQGKAFHFGFDPAPGELDKRGHLFSVVIEPSSWKVMKHVDKNRPKEDPNETLASTKLTFEPGQWYTLRLTTWEQFVKATIDGSQELQASHPSFAVKKPALVLRCLGDGVEIDDIKVWRQAK